MIHRKSKNQSTNSPPRRRRDDADSVRTTAVELSDKYAFRRNRTLTGSSSAKVASGGELHAELQSPRAHVHHLTKLRRHLSLYFIVVAMVAALLYVLVSQTVAVVSIQIQGQELLTESQTVAYERALDEYYQARPIERLRFMLNETEMTSHMQALRPEIKTINIHTGLVPGEAYVSITPREPIATWQIAGSNQYVDSEGVVFATNYGSTPELQIIDESGIQTSQTGSLTSNRFLGFIGLVIAGARQNNITVTKITIPALTTRQVAITTKGQKTLYKLSIDRPVGQQVEDVSRVQKHLLAKGLSPSYVDVRVQGKAFYK